MSIEMIAVIVTGAVTVIGALVAGITSIIVTVRASKKVDTVIAATTGQDAKLDNITILVDGRYSQVLQELADVKRLMAETTGSTADSKDAAKAQKTADAQHALVADAHKKA